jgi:hypothetical protein
VYGNEADLTARGNAMMNYRMEYQAQNGDDEVVHLGQLSVAAARARARRLSEKPGHFFTFGTVVYRMGADADGTDQELYTYFAGTMTEKDLVKDWDK